MPIRGVLVDLDGALLVDGTASPRTGIKKLVTDLHSHGISVAAASGRADAEARLAKSGLDVDAVYTSLKCGSKGSGNFVAAFCDDQGLDRAHCLTVWDDEYGFREGINGRSLSFHAEWGGGRSRYGIRLERPEELVEYLEVFFLKTAPWFAELDSRDGSGRGVTVRALIDGNGAGSELIRQATYRTLKDRERVEVYGASFPMFLLTHMLASAYLDGLLTSDRDQVLWQIYPGHSTTSAAPPVIQASIEHLTLFRGRASGKQYGLQRLENATQSHRARVADDRSAVKFINQMNTVALQRATKVQGKRVYVIDDFTTEGYSLEAARQIFDAAGARSVHLLAFGKYGRRYRVETPKDPKVVEPFQRKAYSDADFHESLTQVSQNAQALTEFSQSLDRLRETTIKTKLLASSPLPGG